MKSLPNAYRKAAKSAKEREAIRDFSRSSMLHAPCSFAPLCVLCALAVNLQVSREIQGLGGSPGGRTEDGTGDSHWPTLRMAPGEAAPLRVVISARAGHSRKPNPASPDLRTGFPENPC
jgi:hypothetical protein